MEEENITYKKDWEKIMDEQDKILRTLDITKNNLNKDNQMYNEYNKEILLKKYNGSD